MGPEIPEAPHGVKVWDVNAYAAIAGVDETKGNPEITRASASGRKP